MSSKPGTTKRWLWPAVWILAGAVILLSGVLAPVGEALRGAPHLPVKWVFKAGPADRVDIENGVALSGGTVYLISKRVYDISKHIDEVDYLHAVDANTGKELWNYSFPGYRETTPAAGGESVYFGMSMQKEGTCYLYSVQSHAGKFLWKALLGDYDVEALSPVTGNGLVYVGTRPALDDNEPETFLYAFDGTSGVQVWKRSIAGGVSGYTLDGNTLYYSTLPGELGAVDAASGRRSWTFETLRQYKAYLVVAGDSLYATITGYFGGDALFAMERATGKERWRFRITGTTLSAPVVADNLLYLGVAQQREMCIDNCPPPPKYVDYLYTLDAITGDQMTQVQTEAPIMGVAVMDAHHVYSVEPDGALSAQEIATGKLKGKLEARNSISGSPVMSGGVVYVGSSWAGSVYAVVATPPATYSVRQTSTTNR